MSLHTLANHLQSAGRGEDKVLVHMTPGEVKGLQALAMSQGGSLTINPETGLPEAGILSALLPMVAGFFLGPAGLGLTAMQSAVAVGALGTAATGSLGKGFMMGLGAYGGAGLGAGLTSVGASQIPATAAGETAANLGQQTFNAVGAPVELSAPIGSATTTGVNTGVSATTGGLEAIKPFANPNVMAANPYGVTAPYNLTTTVPNAPVNLGNITTPPAISPNVVNAGDFAATPNMASSLDVAKSGLNTAGAGTNYGQTIAENMRNTATPVNNIDQIMSQGTPPSTMDKLGAGFDRATSSWEGAKEVWNATPTGTGYGLAATGMGVLQAQQEEAAEKAKAEADAMAASRRGTIRPYEFSTQLTENAFAPRESSSEFKYYVEPRFIPKETYKVAKEGGLMSLAVGGQVEEMSAANAIGANTGYPMANLQTPMYTNPMMSRPTPTNVISPSGDAGVDAYSGELRMASGGAAASKATPTTDTKYSYDPATMKYTQTTTAAPAENNLATNPLVVGMMGLAPYMRTMGGGYAGGQSMLPPMYQNLFGGQKTAQAQPATTTQTMGGVAAPYMPPSGLAAADTSMVPNIPIQPQQNVDRQLGLEAFYPMMEQQLAMKGSNLQAQGYAEGGTANGGYSLGSYSDGGRLLRGPGDGVSDSIPASIGDHQPARLADGEFVVPARIVSEIGNGSTEAGARKLYAMMDRVQKARGKTVGKNKVAVNTKADKLLPA